MLSTKFGEKQNTKVIEFGLKSIVMLVWFLSYSRISIIVSNDIAVQNLKIGGFVLWSYRLNWKVQNKKSFSLLN